MDYSKPYAQWTEQEKSRTRHSHWRYFGWCLLRLKFKWLRHYVRAQSGLYGWQFLIGHRVHQKGEAACFHRSVLDRVTLLGLDTTEA